MTHNINHTVCDITACSINSDEKRKAQFLLAKKDERNIAVRDAVVYAMTHYGVGEGLVPIATSRRNFIILGYVDPNVRENGADMITSDIIAYDGVTHHNQWDLATCTKVSRKINWDILSKYVKVDSLEVAMPDPLNVFILGHAKAICNVNKSYAREWINFLNSLKVLDNLEDIPDEDSTAGMNLTVVSDTLIRLAIMQENLKGEKTVIKKSQVEENPLIREAVKRLVFKLAVDEIKASESAEEEQIEVEQE